MTRFAVIAVIALLAQPAAADRADDVRCHEIAFSRSAESRDLETFSTFIDADARFLGSSVVRGPEEIAAAWAAFFLENGPAIKWRPQFVEVLVEGDLALTRGPYRLTTVDAEGDTIVRWGTFNSVWRRHGNGDWQVVFDAGSPADTPPDADTIAILDQEDDC